MDPVINIEENIGKTVGRRRVTNIPLYSEKMQKTAIELAKTFGIKTGRKGVFRFKTHEEADAWWIQTSIPRN